jgi:integrase
VLTRVRLACSSIDKISSDVEGRPFPSIGDVRKGELLGARWEEIDLEGGIKSGPVWHLPAARTKTGEGADIPLVPQVVEWLEALKVGPGAAFGHRLLPGRQLETFTARPFERKLDGE